METFQTLPSEVFTKVLSFLPAVEDVVHVAITNRFNYERFRGSEIHIAHQVLINQLDVDLLTICVARHAAAAVPWNISPKKRPNYPSQPGLSLSKWHPASSSFDVCAFCITDRIATGILTDANTDPTPRPTEIARVKRSLYILDIICRLLHSTPFTVKEHRPHDPARQNTPFTKFWLNFAPWEWTQIQGLEWLMMDLIDDAYVAKHDGLPVPNRRRVKMKHALQLMLITGIEALESLVVRQEFPAAWEDLHATLQQEDQNTWQNHCYEKITETTYQDYFCWFDLPAAN
ncbi:hypothetical protein DL769_005736 [Monosporascus sp. CRB-8-3]|nr:hypothetical protein DL769_005736 [Monosporascus sp. CRB-8-3]